MGADALIGESGFVGTTLARQASFGHRFRSATIAGIDHGSFATVVCAGAPAQKWIANREPEADRRNLERLIGHLDTIRCDDFILISTVDVFQSPVGVDEQTPVETEGLHPYGLHRRALEQFVERRFARSLIVRLPGLVGPGLRKNVLFDLLNDNNLHAVESRSVFQFYPMVNLWADIRVALEQGLRLVHLTAAPLRVSEIARDAFGRVFEHELPQAPAAYDLRSRHAQLFGGEGDYLYGARESMLAIRAYVQSEPRTVMVDRGSGPDARPRELL